LEGGRGRRGDCNGKKTRPKHDKHKMKRKGVAKGGGGAHGNRKRTRPKN